MQNLTDKLSKLEATDCCQVCRNPLSLAYKKCIDCNLRICDDCIGEVDIETHVNDEGTGYITKGYLICKTCIEKLCCAE